MTSMIKFFFAAGLAAISNNCLAAELPRLEVDALHAEISEMYEAYDKGDPTLFFAKAHPSIHAMVGGKEMFENLTRSTMSQLSNQGSTTMNPSLGEPTQLYDAGDEEVCFVPRITVIETQGQRVRSTGFLVAIRPKGGGEWTYLDGAGLRRDQSLLWLVLPNLQRDVLFPPNYTEGL